MLDDLVWKALANPKRRQVLDLLSKGPLTTGDLAERFEGLSRFAVMQHLNVLVDAGLVAVRRRGKHRFNHLNAVPIQRLHDRWVGPIAEAAAKERLALERYLDETAGTGLEEKMQATNTVRAVRIANEIKLEASPERVFRAMTTEQERWYPYNYGGERLKSIIFEEHVGGRCYEDWGDGAGVLYGTITFYDPPKTLCMRGYLQGGILLENWINIEPAGDGCILKGNITCFGEISDDEELGIRKHGDLSNTLPQLQAYLASTNG